MIATPTGLRAVPGAGHVTLTWDPVPGAIGYLVHRDGAPAVPAEVDVPAVPACRFVDTGHGFATYTVAALCPRQGPFSAPVEAAPLPARAGTTVPVRVDAGRVTRELPRPWTPMIGSEHLSHLLSTDRTGGRPIGEELAAALRLAREELGVKAVRAHAVLGDDLGVYRHGEPYDFTRIDAVYDRVVALGLRPVVELGFMPRDLAADPSRTVFQYEAIISPPKDFEAWGDLVRALVEHLAARYGLRDLIDRWAFEVWNEPNLDVFWSGTREEYFLLYDVTAAAVRDVHPDLRVGGPASAANGWVEDLLAHVARSGAALDFVSTHTYGNAPLDWRPVLSAYGRDVPIWWTEWGPTPTHFHGIGDGPFGAAFVLHGMKSAAGRIDALSHWVVSDHFEELGRPPRLFHGGFGLLTVGNLRKPRFHALALAQRLGEAELFSEVGGDAAGVEAWAARHGDGRVGILIWNGTLNSAQAAGAPELARVIDLTVEGLDRGTYTLTHHRIDATHTNVEAVWQAMGGGDWPTGDQWETLRRADGLDRLTPPTTVTGPTLTLTFDLPMPAVSFLELTPDRPSEA
ncbi:Beta-xylosidase [[Actinomadura] parvosata subsp. kistnae]|uniref:GH39 family glycosyl hydrolase n=1 Tax=[Actinomadura] parvosata TaxID=1955412 RepID=UPI000D2E5DDB|nr:xylan 1,4-beta-xylosidase [Nonomuraea sp. ATCC 55076]SPL90646.1 Beta-xylosidase [Actinomadura parvosata subsp. kistnae]